MCSPLKITSRTESLKTHSPTNTPTHTHTPPFLSGKKKDQYLALVLVRVRVYFELCVFVYEVKVCVGTL